MSIDKTRVDIAGRLRKARENAGLSQSQVATLMGLHRPTVSEMEAGRRRVAAEELARLADVYGVGIEWLAGESASTDQMEEAELAAREMRSLDREDLDKVVELIRSLSRRRRS